MAKLALIPLLLLSMMLLFVPQTKASKSLDYTVSLGEEETIPVAELKYIPDGHISKIENNGYINLFISAHDKAYILNGTSYNNLSVLTDGINSPLAILKPEGTGFEKDYSAFGSIFKNPVTKQMLGIYHAEIRVDSDTSDTQTSSIAIAVSSDNGLTWQKKGQIITGMRVFPLGTLGSGAGQPSALIVGKYIYLYYFDVNYQHPNAIHLARSPLSSNGMPGTWQKYTAKGFTEPGLGGQSIPVLAPFSYIRRIYYTSNPSISFNKYLNKFFAVFETNIGFFSAVSNDGINWSNYKLFFKFPKDTNVTKTVGDIWYGYPSYLSSGTPTDMESLQKGYLYYSRGIFGQDHRLVRRTFTLNIK